MRTQLTGNLRMSFFFLASTFKSQGNKQTNKKNSLGNRVFMWGTGISIQSTFLGKRFIMLGYRPDSITG